MTGSPRPSPSSSSRRRFVDAALSTTGPYSLSYANKGIKVIIRDHVLSLIKEFPMLAADSDRFSHDDGTKVHLLCVRGRLPLARYSGSDVDIDVWLHQSYPFVPPIVYLAGAGAFIDRSNPLIDPFTGAAATPYLKTWECSSSNLLDLVRNMVKLFKLWPPFVFPPAPGNAKAAAPPSGWASLASKREAIDRLYVSFTKEIAVFRANMGKEIASLGSIRDQLRERAWAAYNTENELLREKNALSGAVEKMEKREEVVQEWIDANRSVSLAMAEVEPEDLFQGMDNKSTSVLNDKAESLAIEDVVYALDYALNEKKVVCEDYVKQVRELYRKQFFLLARVKRFSSSSSTTEEKLPRLSFVL